MATTRTSKSTLSQMVPEPEVAAVPSLVLRAFDEVYHFLASVKLAVICIATLAMVLAAATIFESAYGIPASREYFYGHKAFAILLGFLATNIFCAATIRIPWKKRQTGFVVTHIGLLIILAGAFVSLRYGDEGQLGVVEGTTSNELVRINDSIVRVQKLDAASGNWKDSRDFPFTHGAFSWHSDDLTKIANTPSYITQVWATRAALATSIALFLATVFIWVFRRPKWLGILTGSLLTSFFIGTTVGLGILAAMTPAGPKQMLLTDPTDPYTIVATDYLASSGTDEGRSEPDPKGYPTAKIALLVKPPGATETVNRLEGQDWFAAEPATFDRSTRDATPATVAYQYVKGPNVAAFVDDFLHPPANAMKDRVARLHYLDKSKKPRVFEWVLPNDKSKPTITLPDSDLNVTLEGHSPVPAAVAGELLGIAGRDPENSERAARAISLATGEDDVDVVAFGVKRADGSESRYAAFNSFPAYFRSGESPTAEITSIGYFSPPKLTAKGGGMGGRLAMVEVLQTDDGKLYARAFGRDGLMGKPGPIELGKALPLIASVKMPMQISLRVDELMAKAKVRRVYVPHILPKEQADQIMPAVQLEMTVKGVTKPASLVRLNDVIGASTPWETLRFGEAAYRLAFDFDRSPFPFTMGLIKFEPGKDPGSPSPATFRSDITLTDPEMRLKDEERAIYMNNPLTHRGWSFYQSNFGRVKDPETGQKDGAYASYFQVHYDPAWRVVYTGCLLVVLGAFLQFYMRAGLFSDGGKRERELDEAKSRKSEGKSRDPKAPVTKTPKREIAASSERFEDL